MPEQQHALPNLRDLSEEPIINITLANALNSSLSFDLYLYPWSSIEDVRRILFTRFKHQYPSKSHYVLQINGELLRKGTVSSLGLRDGDRIDWFYSCDSRITLSFRFEELDQSMRLRFRPHADTLSLYDRAAQCFVEHLGNDAAKQISTDRGRQAHAHR